MDVEPIIIGTLGLGVVAGLFLLLQRSRGGGGRPGRGLVTRGAQRLVDEGRYEEAARLAMSRENWDEASDLFRRARQPGNAAEAARRAGKLKQAAELYEMAGMREEAATCREEAGLPPAPAPRAPAALGDAPAADPEPGGASDSAEAAFRAALATGRRDADSRMRLEELAREAADELLALSEMRRAADVFRDAELFDEAVHLYVNVLGAPGEAAPLVARLGHHERAAELYEVAGERERAAAAWVEVARQAEEPLSYIDRVEALSEEVAFNFLDLEAKLRALEPASAELHYRLALACDKRGDSRRAREIFALIAQTVGDYKDVAVRVASAAVSNAPRAQERGRKRIDSPIDVDIPLAPPLPTIASTGDEARARPHTSSKPPLRRGSAPPKSGSYSFIDSSRSSRPPPRDSSQPPAAPSVTLSKRELEELVRQAALAAAEHLRRDTALAPSPPPSDRRTRRQRWYGGEVPTLLGLGVEERPVEVALLGDPAVTASKSGPGVEALLAFIEDRPCDLGNIEVFYRLGLAHLGLGRWEQALEAFAAVEEASPGYRDAYRRAEDIKRWQAALGSRRTELGGDGRFTLAGELGRGGMAVVYRARDNVLERDVALKFMAEEVSQNRELRELFQREARAAASLNHPGIVTIHDVGLLEGRAFICMELVDGVPVDELEERLTIVEGLQIARQALDALAYAHERGIVHRDVKPANMMQTKSGLIKLMDFGLAKPMGSGKGRSIVAGTPAFMSPEQLAGDEVDHRADVFGMGVTLYELLTRELPFQGLDRFEPPPALREHVPAIPELIDQAVVRALRPDPDERWPSAAAFAEPIVAVLDAVGAYASRK